MTWLIGLLFNNPIARTIGAALAAVVAVLTFGKIKKREGWKDARDDMAIEDQEHAQDIRDTVRTGLDDRVRDFDDAGFRD